VKSADLRPLFERARKMTQGLESFRIDHVYREQNREADALANQALDETSKSVGGATNNAKNAPPKPVTICCLARYKDGVLQPQEPLDLPDGAHVEVMLRLRK